MIGARYGGKIEGLGCMPATGEIPYTGYGGEALVDEGGDGRA